MKYTFGNIVSVINGKNQKKVVNPNGKYPIYGSGGIMGYADEYLCEANTVVIGRKGSINNPLYVETPFWNVDTAFGLVANKNILNPKYLFYFCKNFNFEKLNTTVTIPSLTKANLLRIEIDIPTLEKQRKVVDALDKIVRIINLRKNQLKLLDNLIKSIFVELFGDPVLNPKCWSTFLCKEISTKIGSGATPRGGRESYKNEGIALIRSMNVYNSKFEYKDLAYITDEQAKRLDSVKVEENDVLLNITGASVARCCIVPQDAIPARVNQHVSIIRCKKEISPSFLCQMLINDNYQKLLLGIATSSGSTREAITKQQIEELKVIVPPIKLQNQFERIVQTIDKLKFSVQKSLDEAENLFQALMQQYFG